MSLGLLSLLQRAEMALRTKKQERLEKLIACFNEWANTNLGYSRVFTREDFVLTGNDDHDMEITYTEDGVTLVTDVYDSVEISALDGIELEERKSVYDLPSLARTVNYIRRRRKNEASWWKKIYRYLTNS